MSVTGTVNTTPEAIARRAAAMDDRTVLASVVTHARKATRYHGGTVVVRQAMPTWAARTLSEMAHDEGARWAGTPDTTGKNERPTVVRPGGRVRLTDLHK